MLKLTIDQLKPEHVIAIGIDPIAEAVSIFE